MCIQNGRVFVFVLCVVGLAAQYTWPQGHVVYPPKPIYPSYPSYPSYPGHSSYQIYPNYPGYPSYPNWVTPNWVTPKPIIPPKPPTHPPGIQGHCYLAEHHMLIPIHQSRSVPGQCKKATCNPGMTISELICPLLKPTPGCMQTQINYGLSYPDCCPKEHCPWS